jgi:predicted nucleic acid-binding protein
MRTGINRVYCDSCVFIAYFNAEPGRIEVLETLFAAIKADDDRILTTSVITLAEVAKVAAERAGGKMDKTTETKLDGFWNDGDLIEFASVTKQTALLARKFIRDATERGYSLKTPDAIHLATANSLGLKTFLTYDDLARFSSLCNLSIVGPAI